MTIPSNNLKLSNINFFVSSTYIDMKEYRNAVIKDLQSRAGIINAQEFFGSRDKKPIETCLEELDKSQVFLMFLGARYGSIDKSYKKSFVEREYDRAGELAVPRFAYIIDENQPVPYKYVSLAGDAEKLKIFKERVRSELTVSPFTTPDDLAQKVYSDLVRELSKYDLIIGNEAEDKEKLNSLKLIEEFKLLPKLLYGKKVSFKAGLGRCKRASKNECIAFSYDYGAAIKRSLEPMDKSLKSLLRGDGPKEVFAHGENAQMLMKLSENEVFNITVKFVLGEYQESRPIYDLEYEPSAIAATVISQFGEKKRVIVDYDYETNLLIGFELVEVRSALS